MIDTHTHLYFDWYDEDREEVINNMVAAGISAIISVGIDLESCLTVDRQTMDYSFYAPQPGVAQEVSRPTAVPLTSYLAPVTGDRRYGYGYIAPNAELDYLRRLAEIQGTGAERLPSEDLMGS